MPVCFSFSQKIVNIVIILMHLQVLKFASRRVTNIEKMVCHTTPYFIRFISLLWILNRISYIYIYIYWYIYICIYMHVYCKYTYICIVYIIMCVYIYLCWYIDRRLLTVYWSKLIEDCSAYEACRIYEPLGIVGKVW